MLFPQPWPDGGKIKRKAGSRRIGCSSKWTETPPLWSAGKSPEGCLRRDLLGGWGGAVPCVMGRHHACPTWDLNRVLEVKKEKNWGAVLAGRFGRIVREGSVSASTGGGRLASGRGGAKGTALEIRLWAGEGGKQYKTMHTTNGFSCWITRCAKT